MLPTYFISHGGGPWAFMDGEFRKSHELLERSLMSIPRELSIQPKAILMISGHWEEKDFTLMSNPNPPMIYDYSGFPEHTYRIQYKAPGSAELTKRVQTLLVQAGFNVPLDPVRGFDHGAFVPLSVMYPDANIPVVQLSIRDNYDPSQHIEAGRALAPLRNEGVMIVGSGLSYHNLRLFGSAGQKPAAEFDRWLNETLREAPAQRIEHLVQWTKAPSARAAQPQEDHFIPLMVALGAAESEKANVIYYQDDFFGSLTVSSFRFGSQVWI